MIAMSSSSVHFSFLISGLRWLCHLYLHCFPILPGSCLATKLQFLAPLAITIFRTISSSSLVCIIKILPMVLWWAEGWEPFAICASTGRLIFPRNKPLLSSNFSHCAPQPTSSACHPPPESTISSEPRSWNSQSHPPWLCLHSSIPSAIDFLPAIIPSPNPIILPSILFSLDIWLKVSLDCHRCFQVI